MRKPSVLVVWLTVFIDLIGFGIVVPLVIRNKKRTVAIGSYKGLPNIYCHAFIISIKLALKNNYN